MSLSKIGSHLLHLIYPNECLICEKEIAVNQHSICSFCFNDLQYTFFERYEEPTPLDQLFWGKVRVENSYALLYFEKGKSAQPFLHALKYNDKPQLGVEMGNLIGEKLLHLKSFQSIEVLIPVPIHPKKEFTRGYNQSEKLADGIAQQLNIPVETNFLKRLKNSESQTKKNRLKRWDGIQNIFSAVKQTNYKHVAIVDDVVTTGATLEVIIRAIQENNPEIRITIISLALTK